MTIYPLSTTNAPLPSGTTGTTSSTSPDSSTVPVDQSVISPLARLQDLLQQVHQNRTERFPKITAQIATNLKNAATQAQTNGYTNAANELNKLAGEFQNASQTGQLPTLWELRHPVAGLQHYRETNGQDSSSPDVSQTLVNAAQSAGLS